MPADLLQQELFGNSGEVWLVALLTALGFVVAFRIVMYMIERYVRGLAQRTETPADDLVVEVLEGTHFLLVLGMAVYLGSLPLTLPPDAEMVLPYVGTLALLAQLALWGNRALTFWFDDYMKRKTEDDPASRTSLAVLAIAARTVFWGLVFVVALDNLGFDVSALVTGLGIGGIAVALAAQNILGDLFASLTIWLDKPFAIGDFLKVGEFLGTVEHIGVKSTRVRANTGEQLIFNNSDLLESRIRNYGRMWERRGSFTIGVTYGTALEKLERVPEIIRQVIEGLDNTRFDRSHLKEFGDSALIYETIYFMTVPDYAAYMDTQQAINLELVRRFEDEGLEFAFPTRTLFVHTEEGAESTSEPESEPSRP